MTSDCLYHQVLRAVAILWRIMRENPSCGIGIAAAGPVEPLVRLLLSDQPEIEAYVEPLRTPRMISDEL